MLWRVKSRRQKGKRGGLRVIYYWMEGAQFWMFFIYGKDEMDDLTPREAKALGAMLSTEVEQRTGK